MVSSMRVELIIAVLFAVVAVAGGCTKPPFFSYTDPALSKLSEKAKFSLEELPGLTFPANYTILKIHRVGEASGIVVKVEAKTPEDFRVERLFIVTPQGDVFALIHSRSKNLTHTGTEDSVKENLPRYRPLPMEDGG